MTQGDPLNLEKKEEEGELDNNLEGRKTRENDIIQRQRKTFQTEEWPVRSNAPKRDKGSNPLDGSSRRSLQPLRAVMIHL